MLLKICDKILITWNKSDVVELYGSVGSLSEALIVSRLLFLTYSWLYLQKWGLDQTFVVNDTGLTRSL